MAARRYVAFVLVFAAGFGVALLTTPRSNRAVRGGNSPQMIDVDYPLTGKAEIRPGHAREVMHFNVVGVRTTCNESFVPVAVAEPERSWTITMTCSFDEKRTYILTPR